MTNETLEQKLILMIRQEGKLAAVKFYMDYMEKVSGTKISLAEAKQVIDTMGDKVLTPQGSETPPSATTSTPQNDINETITGFIKQGNLIYAIKYYHELTGASLRESKDYVDNLKQQLFRQGTSTRKTPITPTNNDSSELTPPAQKTINSKHNSKQDKSGIWIISAIGTGLLILIYLLFFK